MHSIFPLEIEETVLNLLADEDDQGHSALKTCSLVCQAFLPICRKHIFGSIVLNDYTIRTLERLLHETPEIADYIRKLDCTIQDSPPIQAYESLKRISRLEFLEVLDQGLRFEPHDWSKNRMRPALLHLLHLPTLTHFKMTNIRGFVVSDLLPCVNLKYLNIGPLTTVAPEITFPAALPEHSIQLNEFIAGPWIERETSDAIMKLCTARRPDGQPIIDFGSLSKITVALQRLSDDEALQELFRRCHALTNVHISFWDPESRYKRNLPDKLRPSMQTLKHIVVNINLTWLDDDPLSGIPSELENMRTRNIIETIAIKIMVQSSQTDGSYRGDVWSRLDEVLTTPGWFSLKRVSLTIRIASLITSDNELELEVALRKLPETQFLRLSSSNSVSFDFAICSEYMGSRGNNHDLS